MFELKTRVLSKLEAQTNRHTDSDDVAGANAPLICSMRLQVSCVVVSIIAAVIFTLTEHDDHQHSWWCVFEILMQVILVVVGTGYFRLRARLYPDTSVLMPPLLMVAAFSLLCEPVQRLFFNTGHSFEVLIMHTQCNLMLALAACGFRINFQRLAILISVFLTIFSCTISNARGLIPLTVLFAIAAVGWLVLSWWETVSRRLVKAEHKSRPLLWAATCLALPLMLLLPSLGFGANSLTNSLEGFMPSSGGKGAFDPFSRGGVNDGDALVAGNNNIKSFAPLEDAPFLDSDKPSLYDVFNDQFDGPPKKIKNQQRAIALPAELMKHIHQKMAEAKQAGREFSLVREDRKGNKKAIRDLDSPAMFYVAGPVPARFRMQVYEHFDGVTWYPIDLDEISQDRPELYTTLDEVEDRQWLKIAPIGRAFELNNGTATHSLKIANLDGNVIPSPPQLVAVNIAHVNRKDMYHVEKTRIASLQRDSIPTMTPINLVSDYVDRDRLLDCRLSSTAPDKPLVTKVLPQTESTKAIALLARQWTEGLPRGWQQISAIERRLRTHCELDRSVKADVDSADPIADFLFRSRRGPEYLFAASAATMLRTLDFPTRLVSGFYAPSENYDSRKQHTAVFDQNAHFWCEVGIGMETWVTIEASPGYVVSEPPPRLLQRIWRKVVSAAHFVVQHAMYFALAAVLLVLAFVNRRLLQNQVLTICWKLASGKSPAQRAVTLGALIERRLCLAQLDSNSNTTLRRRARQSVFDSVRNELTRVADIADHAMFGHEDASLYDNIELNELATALSFQRLRKLPHQSQMPQGM